MDVCQRRSHNCGAGLGTLWNLILGIASSALTRLKQPDSTKRGEGAKC